MNLPSGVRDNLFFLLAETSAQLSSLDVFLRTVSSAIAQRILDRRGYSYNLKMRIHDGCADALRRAKLEHIDIHSLRGAEGMASGLERLSEICQECVQLTVDLERPRILKRYRKSHMLKHVTRGIQLLENAIDEDDTSAVVRIGDLERKLDRVYRKQFRRHLKDVRKSKNPQGVMASLFICHRIEEMGDVLLAISEFVISAKLGQQMQLDRFHALGAALSDAGLSDTEVELLAHTKSGGAISGISSSQNDNNGYLAVFKDGKRNKLDDERDNVQSWHEIVPGLAPKILGYQKRGKSASLLIEHLPGRTFEHIVRQENDEVLRASLRRLSKTLRAVWSETKRTRKAPTDHMAQLRKRLPEVLRVHPEFGVGRQRIGSTEVASLAELIASAEKLEPALAPPFSVFIHGDFNLDNIIYDHSRKSVHFIDLHRSKYLDYVQDVAVFMVSNYRLQVLEPSTRKRLADVAMSFYEFAAGFAHANRDRRFELRLALALARSFITSARFVMDRSVARNLLLRGIYILQCVQGQNKKNARSFRLPMRMLFE